MGIAFRRCVIGCEAESKHPSERQLRIEYGARHMASRGAYAGFPGMTPAIPKHVTSIIHACNSYSCRAGAEHMPGLVT